MRSVELRTDGTVLITGGLGALGLQVAKSLAVRGVGHLLLTSRRGIATPRREEAVSELEALGARVTIAALDVGRSHRALGRTRPRARRARPLRGVVHAAGLVDDGLLAQQSPERFRDVLCPKVVGAWHLHELTEGADLDFFVLFSSIAGSFGSAGQGSYAAGNSFLDGLAAHRQARGLRGQSIAWGPWAERGLAAQLDRAQQARFARQGLSFLQPHEGIALFEALLARREAQVVAAPLDVRALRELFGSSVPPFWRALVRSSGGGRVTAKGSWARELSALSAAQREQAVTGVVQAEVARVLSFGDASDVPLDKPLKDLGLDSLMAVELGNALSRRSGVTIPATLAFNHPTPRAIASYLLGEVLALSAPAAPVSVVAQTAVAEPIAIVSMGCRFPGGVH